MLNILKNTGQRIVYIWMRSMSFMVERKSLKSNNKRRRPPWYCPYGIDFQEDKCPKYQGR